MFKEEPLDRFRQRALALAPSMGFPAAQVNESLGIILNSLGAEWVSEQVDTIRRGDPLPFRVHPIGGLFATPGEPQVAEVMELAEYLRLVATSSALPEVLANLRAQYRSTFLQLAFAFRFAQLSEETPLLEPPVQGGRVGDLDVTVHGNRYLVECYAPRAKLKRESSDEVQWLTHRSIEVVKDRDRVFSIAIALDAMPSAAERKLIVRAVKRLADQLEAQGWDGSGFPPTRLYVGENATVSVGLTVPTGPGENYVAVLDRAFPRFGEEPATLVAVRMATRAEILEFTSDTPPGEARDHVAVWFPRTYAHLPDEADAEMSALIPKLKTKLGQTKMDGASRILIVETWAAAYPSRVSQDTRSEIRRQLFESHSDVAGVAFVHRALNQQRHRFRYDFVELGNETCGGEVLADLKDLEGSLWVPEWSLFGRDVT